jgi:hypothetical protein
VYQLGRDNQHDLNQFCIDILYRGFCKLATPLVKKRTKHFSNSTIVQGSQTADLFLKTWHLVCGGSFSQCKLLCESFLRSSHVANVILRLSLTSDLFLSRSLSRLLFDLLNSVWFSKFDHFSARFHREQIATQLQSSFVFEAMQKITSPVDFADISSRNYADFIMSRLPSDVRFIFLVEFDLLFWFLFIFLNFRFLELTCCELFIFYQTTFHPAAFQSKRFQPLSHSKSNHSGRFCVVFAV